MISIRMWIPNDMHSWARVIKVSISKPFYDFMPSRNIESSIIGNKIEMDFYYMITTNCHINIYLKSSIIEALVND